MKKRFRIRGIIIILISLLGFVGWPLLGVIGIAIGAVVIFLDTREKRKEAKQEKQWKEMAAAHQEKIVAERERFDAELEAIEQVDITIDSNAPNLKRHKLADKPETIFSSITKRTRIEKLFPLVVIDTETTGISKQGNRIIELAAIKYDYDFEPSSCFSTLLNPGMPIPADSVAVHNITDEMVEDAPTLNQVAKAFTDYIKGCNILGHNLKFDLEFLFVSGIEIPTDAKFYDTLPLSRATITKSMIENYKLTTLCDYFGIYRSDAHRSLSDCYATAKVFEKLVEIRHDM